MIDQLLDKQIKIGARKQHYYAIASIVSFQMGQIKQALANWDLVMQQAITPDQMKKALHAKVADLAELLLPVYQTALSLRYYKQAFGEFPEWVSFLGGKKANPEYLEAWIKNSVDLYLDLDKRFGANEKGDRLCTIAFGESFQKMCEQVKIKGEE